MNTVLSVEELRRVGHRTRVFTVELAGNKGHDAFCSEECLLTVWPKEDSDSVRLEEYLEHRKSFKCFACDKIIELEESKDGNA